MQCVKLELQKITELSLHYTLRSYKSCIFQNDLSWELEFYLDTSQNKLDKNTFGRLQQLTHQYVCLTIVIPLNNVTLFTLPKFSPNRILTGR